MQSLVSPSYSGIAVDDDGLLRPAGPGRLSLLFTMSHRLCGPPVDRLIAELQLWRNPRLAPQCRFSAGLILFNAWICWRHQLTLPDYRVIVKYSRDRSDFIKGWKYGLDELSYTAHMRVFQTLEESGFIAQEITPPGGRHRSFFYPLPPLEKVFATRREAISVERVNHEVLRLKDEDKELLDYAETSQTQSLRRGIYRLNALNSRADFTLQVPASYLRSAYSPQGFSRTPPFQPVSRAATFTREYFFAPFSGTSMDQEILKRAPEGEEQQAEEGERGRARDTSSPYPSSTQTVQSVISAHKSMLFSGITPHFLQGPMTLSVPLDGLTTYWRSFSRGSWHLGGRYYCDAASIPRELRAHLRIDEEETVELDYSAMHARMLYAEAGVTLEGDPYAIDLGVRLTPPEARSAAKQALLILLNARNRFAAKGALQSAMERGDIPGIGRVTPLELIDAAVKHHPAIARWFHMDRGIELQFRDSKIADTIFRIFVDCRRPILGLHDGFRVCRQDEELLHEAMVDAYVAECGAMPVIDKKEDTPPVTGGESEEEGP